MVPGTYSMTTYGRPSWTPWSNTATTFGCESRAMVLASFAKAFMSNPATPAVVIIFTATVRSRRSSCAS